MSTAVGQIVRLNHEIERLRAENQKLRDAIEAVPDIRVQEAALVGENMILIAENQKLRDALNKISVGGDVAWHYEDIAREALK